MNKQDIIVKETYSDFIKDLLTDINNNNKICKNGKQFIKTHELVEYCFSQNTTIDKATGINFKQEKLMRKSPVKENLPIETTLGTVYAIKNNSVVEFYSYFNRSLERFFGKEYDDFFTTVVTIHNMNKSDIHTFGNNNRFDDMDELISNCSERSIDFLMALLMNDFILYLKKNI